MTHPGVQAEATPAPSVRYRLHLDVEAMTDPGVQVEATPVRLSLW
jgi:hypothetical protein